MIMYILRRQSGVLKASQLNNRICHQAIVVRLFRPCLLLQAVNQQPVCDRYKLPRIAVHCDPIPLLGRGRIVLRLQGRNKPVYAFLPDHLGEAGHVVGVVATEAVLTLLFLADVLGQKALPPSLNATPSVSLVVSPRVLLGP